MSAGLNNFRHFYVRNFAFFLLKNELIYFISPEEAKKMFLTLIILNEFIQGGV